MTNKDQVQCLMQKNISVKKSKRKSISTRTRFEVLKRDGFKCQYCGATADQNALHIDHITPVARGGSNEMHNLVTACSNCNLGKGAISLTVIPQSLSETADQLLQPTIAKYQAAVSAHENRSIDQLTKVFNLMFPDGWDCVKEKEVRRIERAIENLGFDFVSMVAKDVGMPWVRDKFAYFAAAIRNKYDAMGVAR